MILTTKNKNTYLYSERLNRIQLLHPIVHHLITLKNRGVDLRKWLEGRKDGKTNIPGYGHAASDEVRYYYRKYLLLKRSGYFKPVDLKIGSSGRLRAEAIKSGLVNNKHVIFEVTDACNLKCKYCVYGELYDKHGPRRNRDMNIRKAKLLIDYMQEYWNSNANKSHETEIRIGFYGGEPLLNFPFIKEIVEYTRGITLNHNHFTYGFTSNGILVHRYIDYLVKHRFRMLISLDGNEKGNGHRLFPDGSPSHEAVYRNIMLIKERDPHYFEKYVEFNAVLHNLNSFCSIYDYFQSHFDKRVQVSELNKVGIRESMRREFLKVFKDEGRSLNRSKNRDRIEKEILEHTAKGVKLAEFLDKYTGCVFNDHYDLLYPKRNHIEMSTGTCVPLSNRLYMSVSGKIFPCERIGDEYALGHVDDNGVHIDFERIAARYNHHYQRLREQCQECSNIAACPTCIWQMDIKNDGYRCKNFIDRSQLKRRLCGRMTDLEENRGYYWRLMEGEEIE